MELSQYFQMSAEHVHVFASLVLASALAEVAGNKYPLAKAAFAAVALEPGEVLGLVPALPFALVLEQEPAFGPVALLQTLAVPSLLVALLFLLLCPADKFPYPEQYSQGLLNVHLIALTLQSQSRIAWRFSTKYLLFEQYERALLSSFSRNSICTNCAIATMFTVSNR